MAEFKPYYNDSKSESDASHRNTPEFYTAQLTKKEYAQLLKEDKEAKASAHKNRTRSRLREIYKGENKEIPPSLQEEFDEQVPQTTQLQELLKEQKAYKQEKYKEKIAERFKVLFPEEQKTLDKTKNEKNTAQPKGNQPLQEGAGILNSQIDTTNNTSTYLNSLASSSPIDFMIGVNESSAHITALQEKEQNELQESLPEIDQPTGLPTKQEKAKVAKGSKITKDNAKDLETKPKTKENPKDKIHVESQIDTNKATPIQKQRNNIIDKIKGFFSRLFGSGTVSQNVEAIKANIDSIPTTDETIQNDLGKNPEVTLVGEADPQQSEQQKEQAEKQTLENKQKADQESQKDFGENNLYPEIKKEKLKPQIETVALEKNPEVSLQKIEKLPTQVLATFNEQAKQQIDAKVQKELAKETIAKTEKENKFEQEKKLNNAKITEETSKVEAEQKTLQKETQQEVEQNKKTWKQENEKILAKANKDLETEKDKTEQDIFSNSQQVNKEIGQEYEKGDKEIKQEKTNTTKQVEGKKDEALNKEKGFWESLGDTFSSFIESIKDAINYLFDALKRFVKNTVERIKKVAVALIDKAKNFAIKMLKAFGEFAKKVVSIVLIAFPETAKKINALIDKAVDKAEKVINALAEGLKKAVCMLLDALGAVLIALLDAYQKLINAILDVFKFLVVGLFEIMAGIGRLISAASDSPSHFWGQLSEEVIGVDITKPLPGEITEPANTTSQLTNQALQRGDITPTDAATLGKEKMDPQDVVVDPVLTNPVLDKALMNQFAQMPEGEHEFPGSEEADETGKDMKAEAMGLNESPENQSVTTETPQQASPQMDAQAPQAIGPFKGPAERLAYYADTVVDSLKKAVIEWWSKHKVGIIIGIIAGIAGLILANVVTGGAIMAALPPLLQLLAVAMGIMGVVDMAKYFGDYLSSSWKGNIQQGAKSLARGFAALAIELIFTLLFGGKAALKAAKSTMKTLSKEGVKGSVRLAKQGIKSGVKSTVGAVGDLWNVGKRGGKALMKNGKMLVKGISNGFTKGVKSVDELMGKLKSQFRFRKFKIVIKKRRWQLLGEFNPYVVIAEGDRTGELHRVDEDTVRGLKYGDDVKVTIDGSEVNAKYVTNKDVLHATDEKYVKFWERYTGLSAKGKTLHHTYEKAEAPNYAPTEFQPEFIHSPKRMKPIPLGIENNVIHLRKIRIMWNRFYSAMDEALEELTEIQVKRGFDEFVEYTVDFIDDMLIQARNLRARGLSDSEIEELLDNTCNEWLRNNNLAGKITDCINNSRN